MATKTQTVTKGQSCYLYSETQSGFNCDGYNLYGWDKSANASIPQYAAEAEVTFNNDTNLYAIWSNYDIYHVTFNPNGGTGKRFRQPFEKEILKPLTKNIFSYTDYIFKGWATQPNGVIIYNDEEEISLTHDISLYAKWDNENYEPDIPQSDEYFYIKCDNGSINFSLSLRKHDSNYSEITDRLPHIEFSKDKQNWNDAVLNETIIKLSQDEKAYFRQKNNASYKNLTTKNEIYQFTTQDSNEHYKVSLGGNIQTLISYDGSRTDVPEYCFQHLFSTFGSSTVNVNPIIIDDIQELNFGGRELGGFCYMGMFSNNNYENKPQRINIPAKILNECSYYYTFNGMQISSLYFSFESFDDLHIRSVEGMIDMYDVKNPSKIIPLYINKTYEDVKKLIIEYKLFYESEYVIGVTYEIMCLDKTMIAELISEGEWRIKEKNYSGDDSNINYFYIEGFEGENDICLVHDDLSGNTIDAEFLSNIHIEYSEDKQNWYPMVINETALNVTPNKKYYFRRSIDDGDIATLSRDRRKFVRFIKVRTPPPEGDGDINKEFRINIGGNIQTLLKHDGNRNDVPEFCFYQLFMDMHAIEDMSQLKLPAVQLSPYCYARMFENSTIYERRFDHIAPALPATTLASHCYWAMFSGCTNLTQAPALPATALASHCYWAMFSGCTSLTQAPVLPATTLADSCYNFMFYACTSLTQAPFLPATTLVDGCYQQMFDKCFRLKILSVGFTNWLDEDGTHDATESWLNNVSETGAFYCPDSLPNDRGVNRIPMGWKINSDEPIVIVAPVNKKPSNYLTFEAEEDNTFITTEIIDEAPPVSLCYSTNNNNWYEFISGFTVIKLNKGQKAYIAANENNKTINGSGINYHQFTITKKCKVSGNINSLLDSENPPTVLTEPRCFQNLFKNTNITQAPELPATTLSDECYWCMFQGCSNLTQAPILPATNLANWCYLAMFWGCTNLSSITVKFTNWGKLPLDDYTRNWVKDVAKTGNFYCPNELPNVRGESNIPENWDVIN